jgi:hypothetical protein
MKMVALTLSILGSLCIIMAALTDVGVAPAFVGEAMEFGAKVTTTLFWGGLAALLCLAGISFGVISSGEL